MADFKEDNLKEFLNAMKGSGTTPSPALLAAIKSLSGIGERKLKAIVKDIFGHYPPKDPDGGVRNLFL